MKVMQLPPDISKTTLSPQSVGLAGFEPMAGSFTLWFIEEKNTAMVFCHSSSLRKEIQEINWKRKTEQVRLNFSDHWSHTTLKYCTLCQCTEVIIKGMRFLS